MDNTLTGDPTTEEAAQVQEMIRKCVAEVEQLRKRMRRDQSEIERSRSRTQTMLAGLRVDLEKIQAA